MNKPVAPTAYKDEYQERLRALITDKIQGKEIVAAQHEQAGNVIDLMEALQASIKQADEKQPPKNKGFRKRTR